MQREILSTAPHNSDGEAGAVQAQARPKPDTRTFYRTAQVDGLKIFYREAGPVDAPTVVLLHGYPTSSRMFRNLIPLLATRYHVIAPDYPGFGSSDAPAATAFDYTFDHLAAIVDEFLEQKQITRYSIYMQDYGAPVGFRLATLHPERIEAIVSQNGNAYDEGLTPFWNEYLRPFWADRSPDNTDKVRSLFSLDSTKMQYQAGFRDAAHVDPETWTIDQKLLDRPGNAEIQLALLYDYRTNPPLYATWHAYLKQSQVPVLAVWGRNDPIFAPAGAEAFQRDSSRAEVHLLDTGHFALEEEAEEIGRLMLDFLDRCVSQR